MKSSLQNICDARITIKDCRKCQNWSSIEPLLYELFKACESYNRETQQFAKLRSDENTNLEVQYNGIKKCITNIDACITKLHGKGVHFIQAESLDIFCDAFYQAMLYEFSEEQLNTAVY